MKSNGYEFNRFDICEAYYCFAYNWHKGQWSEEYQFLGKLHRIGFRPGLSAHKYSNLTDNGKMIYKGLVKRFN